MQALGKSARPVEGLCAIGSTVGGRRGADCPVFLPGSSRGAALAFGYPLGRQLAGQWLHQNSLRLITAAVSAFLHFTQADFGVIIGMKISSGRNYMTYITKNEAETEAVGASLAASLPDGSVVALYGDLGAGKTAFVRGMARGMGIDAHVCSPTFTIVNEYLGARCLFHFDMYRLSSSDELFDIGWEDYRARGGVCAVEWSENVRDAFEGDEIEVTLEKLSDNERRITIGGNG